MTQSETHSGTEARRCPRGADEGGNQHAITPAPKRGAAFGGGGARVCAQYGAQELGGRERCNGHVGLLCHFVNCADGRRLVLIKYLMREAISMQSLETKRRGVKHAMMREAISLQSKVIRGMVRRHQAPSTLAPL